MPWHQMFILIHATTAAAALAVGLVAFRVPRLILPHAVLVVAMTVTLAGALWAGWEQNPPAARLVFLGLLGIACLMSVRAVVAARHRGAQAGGPVDARRESAGGLVFSNVGLVTGFVAIAVTRMDAQPLVVTAAAVLAVLLTRAGLLWALSRHPRSGWPSAEHRLPAGRV